MTDQIFFQPYLPNSLFRPGIDLWLLDCEKTELPAQFHKFLQEDEIRSANRYRMAERTRLAFASRVVLRLILSSYLQIHPHEIDIQRNDYQKPILEPTHQLYFNTSHSGSQILIGVSRNYTIGVDIEIIQDNIPWQSIAKRTFAPSEVNLIENAADPKTMFYKIWTAKESFMKGYGSGFHFPVDRFSITYTTGLHGSVNSSLPLSPADWSIKNFFVQPNSMAAVAAPANIPHLAGVEVTAEVLIQLAGSWNIA
jgi:4'-phosphopantetheinyl transferase